MREKNLTPNAKKFEEFEQFLVELRPHIRPDQRNKQFKTIKKAIESDWKAIGRPSLTLDREFGFSKRIRYSEGLDGNLDSEEYESFDTEEAKRVVFLKKAIFLKRRLNFDMILPKSLKKPLLEPDNSTIVEIEKIIGGVLPVVGGDPENMDFGVIIEDGHVVGLGLDGSRLRYDYNSRDGDDHHFYECFWNQKNIRSFADYEERFQKIINDDEPWERIHYRAGKIFDYFWEWEENIRKDKENLRYPGLRTYFPDLKENRKEPPMPSFNFSDREIEVFNRIRQMILNGVDPQEKEIQDMIECLLAISSDPEVIEELSEKIAQLPHLQSLNLSDNGLSTLPDSVGDLLELQTLNLSKNQFSELPRCIHKLGKLRALDLSKNQFSELPGWLGSLGKLRALDLSNNQFSELLGWINNLDKLKFLDLGENPLNLLPDSIADLPELRTLNLSEGIRNNLISKQLRLYDKLGLMINIKKY